MPSHATRAGLRNPERHTLITCRVPFPQPGSTTTTATAAATATTTKEKEQKRKRGKERRERRRKRKRKNVLGFTSFIRLQNCFLRSVCRPPCTLAALTTRSARWLHPPEHRPTSKCSMCPPKTWIDLIAHFTRSLSQVPLTCNAFFGTTSTLWVFKLALGRLADHTKWEDGFPHLYGTLGRDDVLSVERFDRGEGQTWAEAMSASTWLE